MTDKQTFTPSTCRVIYDLHREGIKKIAVLIRHSEKCQTRVPGMEPFMPLTPEGQKMALDFGSCLPPDLAPRFFSSTFGRCIETAYLIDKGVARTHGTLLPDPLKVSMLLTPFYIKDIRSVASQAVEVGNEAMIKKWFDKELSSSIILDPETAAGTQVRYMAACLDELGDSQVALCVSHDWNLFAVKEFAMQLSFAENTVINYLEGIVCFRKEDRLKFISPGHSPVDVDPGKLPHTRIDDL